MKKLLLMLLIGAAGYGAWRMSPSRSSVKLYDQFWIDREPRSEADKFRAFFAIGKGFGHVAQRTAWTGAWEGFRHQARGGQLEMVFPHDGTRATVTYRAYKCDVPRFDYCLDVSGSDKLARKYFSRRDWHVHDDADAERLAESLAR
jgi:hypothetical protein